MTRPLTVRPIEQHELDAAGAILAEAMTDDPYHAGLFSTEAQLRQVLMEMIVPTLRVAQHEGDAMVCATADSRPGAVSEEILGIALWYPPDRLYPRSRVVWRELGRVSLKLGLRHPIAYLRISKSYAELRRAHPKEPPHWYLVGLAVRKRRGVGRALLEERAQRADEAGLGIYLETFREANLPFLEHVGFKIHREFRARKGLWGWGLLRPPRALKSDGPEARASPGANE